MHDNSNHIIPPTNGLQRVAHNACYGISYDAVKCRVYFDVIGFWKNHASVPEFLKDWDKVLQLVKKGFTMLVDMRTMITHPQQLNDLHKESMDKVLSAGVGRVAYVMPNDKIACFQVIDNGMNPELNTQQFSTCEEAEQWLGQPSV